MQTLILITYSDGTLDKYSSVRLPGHIPAAEALRSLQRTNSLNVHDFMPDPSTGSHPITTDWAYMGNPWVFSQDHDTVLDGWWRWQNVQAQVLHVTEVPAEYNHLDEVEYMTRAEWEAAWVETGEDDVRYLVRLYQLYGWRLTDGAVPWPDDERVLEQVEDYLELETTHKALYWNDAPATTEHSY